MVRIVFHLHQIYSDSHFSFHVIHIFFLLLGECHISPKQAFSNVNERITLGNVNILVMKCCFLMAFIFARSIFLGFMLSSRMGNGFNAS